jgi:hypothetical protein
MTKKIILFTAAGGIALAASALALPCWAQEDAGEGIARGVMGGIEGHERRRHHEGDRDWDHDRHRHHRGDRDWDHDRHHEGDRDHERRREHDGD